MKIFLWSNEQLPNRKFIFYVKVARKCLMPTRIMVQNIYLLQKKKNFSIQNHNYAEKYFKLMVAKQVRCCEDNIYPFWLVN